MVPGDARELVLRPKEEDGGAGRRAEGWTEPLLVTWLTLCNMVRQIKLPEFEKIFGRETQEINQ
jgi:hypothetical protein